jgi:hypothetical protein
MILPLVPIGHETNQGIHHMKNNIVSAVTPAILASAAILLSFRSVNTSALCAEIFCAVGIGAIMVLDYRAN